MSENNQLNIYKFNQHMLEEVAPKFFDMDNTSLLRTGIYGYINELYSTIAEGTAYKISELANEFLPYSSKIDRNIYKYASFVRYTDFYAKPAVIPLAIYMSETNLLQKSIKYDGYYEFIIDKNAQIQIGDYFYMFDYDIIITIKDSIKGLIYNVQFDIDDDNPNNINRYINSISVDENGGKFLYIVLDCYQMRRERFEKEMSTGNIVDLMNFELNFEGELYKFDIYYKSPKSDKYEKLIKIPENNAPVKDKFCYYHYVKDNNNSKLKISFSGLSGYFLPDNGSKFIVDIYTTEGEKGNFKYVGDDIKFVITSERFDYEGMIFFTSVLGDSKLGKNSKSITEIKDITSSSMTTINSINTDNDLNEYFRDKLNNEINFIKSRDDIIKRTYNGFTKLYVDNMLIGSNTMNLDVNNSYFTDGERLKTLSAGQEFIYKTGSSSDIDFKSVTPEKFEYLNPFIHTIDITNSICSTYMVSINRDIRMIPEFINKEGFIQPILSELSINRNAILDNSYTIRCNMKLTNITTGIGDLLVSGKLKFVLHLSEDMYIYLDAIDISKEGTLTIGKDIETDDFINSLGKIRIKNSIYIKGILQPEAMIDMNDLKIKLLSFHNIDGTESIPLEYKDLISDPSLDGYTLSNVYNNLEDFSFVINMSDVFNISAKYTKAPVGTDFVISLKGIPLLKNSYRNDIPLLNRICDRLYEYKLQMKEVIDLLDNYTIDLKFLNTYGKSRSFTLNNGTVIESNNINIKFDVGLNSYSGVNMNDLKYEIQVYIANFIASINNNKIGEYNIFISNLIKALELDFPQIKYLKYKGICDYGPEIQNIQYIKPKREDVSYNDLQDLIPEYFNVEYIWDDKEQRYRPDIDINFI